MTEVTQEPTFRIGEVAERLGVTPRTIRYYQELGLVHAGSGHVKGTHRLYTEADVARLADLIRLRDLLGLSLEELKTLIEAEEARAELRGRWAESHDDAERAAILETGDPATSAASSSSCRRGSARSPRPSSSSPRAWPSWRRASRSCVSRRRACRRR